MKEIIKDKAFTLAEVLITLTIIGVIAALTIPNLMQKWSDHADVARVKKTYSTISNALNMAASEYGEFDSWNWPYQNANQANGVHLINMLSKYIKSTKIYNYGDKTCPKVYINDLSGKVYNNTVNYSILRTQNGSDLLVGAINPDQEAGTTYSIIFDINGINKTPNRLGFDVFFYFFEKDKFFRGPTEHSYIYADKRFCNLFVPDAAWTNGGSCIYYVIRHGNMDYKYRDVSAEW